MIESRQRRGADSRPVFHDAWLFKMSFLQDAFVS